MVCSTSPRESVAKGSPTAIVLVFEFPVSWIMKNKLLLKSPNLWYFVMSAFTKESGSNQNKCFIENKHLKNWKIVKAIHSVDDKWHLLLKYNHVVWNICALDRVKHRTLQKGQDSNLVVVNVDHISTNGRVQGRSTINHSYHL